MLFKILKPIKQLHIFASFTMNNREKIKKTSFISRRHVWLAQVALFNKCLVDVNFKMAMSRAHNSYRGAELQKRHICRISSVLILYFCNLNCLKDI